MASNNNCTFVGRLGKDPEVTITTGGTKIAKFSLAVDRHGKDRNGNKLDPDWFNVKIFGKQAESAGEYLRKGSKVVIVGAVHIEKWEKDGQKHQQTVIDGDGFQMLDQRQDSQPAQTAAPSAPPVASAGYIDEGDIPPW